MLVLCEARAAAEPVRFTEERAQRDVEVGVLPVRARRHDREERHAPVRPSSPAAAVVALHVLLVVIISFGPERPRRARRRRRAPRRWRAVARGGGKARPKHALRRVTKTVTLTTTTHIARRSQAASEARQERA